MALRIRTDKAPRSYIDFPWLRWTEGFKIEWRARPEIAPDYKEPFLTPAHGGDTETLYYPLEEQPELVFKFAKIETLEDANKFADDFGFLGFEFSSRLQRPRRQGERRAFGENVNDWLREAVKIKTVLDTWFALEEKDLRFLRKFIVWKRHTVSAVIRDRTWVEQIVPIKKWKHGDLTGPARFYIQEQTNRSLSEAVSIKLVTDKHGRMAQYVAPADLLAALWFQVAQILSGQKKIRACEECGGKMDVSQNRSHKRVHKNCSLRRRMARYRKSLKENQ